MAASGWSEDELAIALLNDNENDQIEGLRQRTGWGRESLETAMALTPLKAEPAMTALTRSCIDLTSNVGSSSSLSTAFVDLTLGDHPNETEFIAASDIKENINPNAGKHQKGDEKRPLFEIFKKKPEETKVMSMSSTTNGLRKQQQQRQPCVERKSIGHLSKRGYVIRKSCLSATQIQKIKSEMYMRPFIAFNSKNSFSTQRNIGFSLLRETSGEFFLPRFYGEENFGVPEYSELENGVDLLNENIEFIKPLRDYQEDIVGKYIRHMDYNGGGGILEVPCGRGKTVIALKIVSILKKKALIIVHKEFLVNQWIERIREFIPTCRVGKIQAQKLDVDDKDIVIGMVQTLSTKQFSEDVYSQFGITVIDEVHRIGSEEFSKTLFRTVTPYMLGISATVDRKDKLTKLLYMFIGPKIYSESRCTDDMVTVRAIEYTDPSNDEFHTQEVDSKGNTQYSKMISKLCSYFPRSNFIVRLIIDLLIENIEGQIMVLAHNKNLLTYLHDRIIEDGRYSVGYYVGGMKDEELRKTESKQVVVATYAMAAEALDIKTLSRLVMATPKTDITQPVGRILRMKHECIKPIIVDVVDSHQCFRNQYQQRKRFYRKSSYVVQTVQSHQYKDMTTSFVS